MLNDLWHTKALPGGMIDREVTTLFAQRMWASAVKGYGSDLHTLDWETPDWNMLASLQKDVWHFSSAKNYQQLRELSNAMIGPDGKVRTESQFFEEARGINEKFVKQHLAVERNLAIASAQESSKWVSIQEDKDIFPLIAFDVVVDGHTSEICLPLSGVIVPVDHPYVKIYYPPNHFGCRTTTRKLRSGKITTDLPYPDIPEMFRTNLAQEGLIFPPGHAYYVDIPEQVKKGGMAAMRKELTEVAKKRLTGKSVEVDGLGKVEFTVHGIKEMINQPHKNYVIKNQLVTVANRLLEHSQVIASHEMDKGDIKSFHYLKVKGLDDNYLVVREYRNGNKALYSIVDKIK